MNAAQVIAVAALALVVYAVGFFGVRKVAHVSRSIAMAPVNSMWLASGATGLSWLAGVSGWISPVASVVFSVVGLAWLAASGWALFRTTRRATSR